MTVDLKGLEPSQFSLRGSYSATELQIVGRDMNADVITTSLNAGCIQHMFGS